MSNFTEKNVLR